MGVFLHQFLDEPFVLDLTVMFGGDFASHIIIIRIAMPRMQMQQQGHQRLLGLVAQRGSAAALYVTHLELEFLFVDEEER